MPGTIGAFVGIEGLLQKILIGGKIEFYPYSILMALKYEKTYWKDFGQKD